MRDAYKRIDPQSDVITLVAGDRDCVPAFEALRADGFGVELFLWDHASKDLRETCENFVSLNAHVAYLQYTRRQALAQSARRAS